MLKIKELSPEELMIHYQLSGPETAYQAFEELYHRYAKRVYGYLNQRTKSAFDSDDLLQKVFFKVHHSKHLYKDKYKFEQWLMVISKTTLLDHFRSDKRYEKRLSGHALNLRDPNEVETEVELNLNLNDEDLEILQMKYVDDLSYKEISAIFNKSEVSLRKKVSRMIDKLKKD